MAKATLKKLPAIAMPKAPKPPKRSMAFDKLRTGIEKASSKALSKKAPKTSVAKFKSPMVLSSKLKAMK
jgi:hypothetical protein